MFSHKSSSIDSWQAAKLGIFLETWNPYQLRVFPNFCNELGEIVLGDNLAKTPSYLKKHFGLRIQSTEHFKTTLRNSHSEVFGKKLYLIFLAKFTGKHLFHSPFLNSFIKKDRRFPVHFAKFLKLVSFYFLPSFYFFTKW